MAMMEFMGKETNCDSCDPYIVYKSEAHIEVLPLDLTADNSDILNRLGPTVGLIAGADLIYDDTLTQVCPLNTFLFFFLFFVKNHQFGWWAKQ